MVVGNCDADAEDISKLLEIHAELFAQNKAERDHPTDVIFDEDTVAQLNLVEAALRLRQSLDSLPFERDDCLEIFPTTNISLVKQDCSEWVVCVRVLAWICVGLAQHATMIVEHGMEYFKIVNGPIVQTMPVMT